MAKAQNIKTNSILIPVNVSKTAGWLINSVDPNRTSYSEASDLGLHYLLLPIYPNT